MIDDVLLEQAQPRRASPVTYRRSVARVRPVRDARWQPWYRRVANQGPASIPASVSERPPRAPASAPGGTRGLAPHPGLCPGSPRDPRNPIPREPGMESPSGALPRNPRGSGSESRGSPGAGPRVGASSRAPLSGGSGGGAPGCYLPSSKCIVRSTTLPLAASAASPVPIPDPSRVSQ
jgi:hypothetical protein